ncbi:MAG: hypothetical protein WCV79_02735 [Candidatus Paceibacterota bacterium]
MSLEPKDEEFIESIVRKACDDVVTSSVRGSERVEERIDGMESRVYTRLAEIEDQMVRILYPEPSSRML